MKDSGISTCSLRFGPIRRGCQMGWQSETPVLNCSRRQFDVSSFLTWCPQYILAETSLDVGRRWAVLSPELLLNGTDARSARSDMAKDGYTPDGDTTNEISLCTCIALLLSQYVRRFDDGFAHSAARYHYSAYECCGRKPVTLRRAGARLQYLEPAMCAPGNLIRFRKTAVL